MASASHTWAALETLLLPIDSSWMRTLFYRLFRQVMVSLSSTLVRVFPVNPTCVHSSLSRINSFDSISSANWTFPGNPLCCGFFRHFFPFRILLSPHTLTLSWGRVLRKVLASQCSERKQRRGKRLHKKRQLRGQTIVKFTTSIGILWANRTQRKHLTINGKYHRPHHLGVSCPGELQPGLLVPEF